MSFIALVARNLFRQRVRTLLTVLGISIGIMTVVALGVITEGMKATMGDLLQLGGSDFMVAQEGSADLSFSIVTEDEWRAIGDRDDVAWAHGVLMHITKVGSNPFFVVSGVRPEDLIQSPPELLQGELLAPGAGDQILLGEQAAGDLGLKIGDDLAVGNRNFAIVGIYRSGTQWQDAGSYAPLSVVQEIVGRPGIVTVVYVKVAPGAVPGEVATAIEEQLPQIAAISTVSDYGEVDQGLQIIDALNMAISVLAVGIGAIGVMNTMIMSVFERTREIGILRAVGWNGQRILRMIALESLLLCLIAALAGMLLGLLAVRGVMLIQTVSMFLEPVVSPAIVLRALIVAVIVAFIGAIYPAVRAVRLTPMEALRHE